MSYQNQQPRPVRIVDFVVVSNAPLKLELDDGTKLVAQLVPVRVMEMNVKTPDGQPTYSVQFQQIMDQIPPDDQLAKIFNSRA